MMNVTEAQNTFAVRLYEWALRDFLRELEEGCPVMSRVGLNNRVVTAFVAWAESLSSAERRTLGRAMVRRMHTNAASLRGEALSEEEGEFWNKEFYEQVTIREHQLPGLPTADERLPSFRPVDPGHCLDALAASLDPLLGPPRRRRSSIHCTRRIGDWKLITDFIFMRRDRWLWTEYHFLRKDGTPVRGASENDLCPRSLFRFYGVWDTFVMVPSQADSEPMARVIADLAKYFVAQADPLFAGLGIGE